MYAADSAVDSVSREPFVAIETLEFSFFIVFELLII